jgi:hypothetical protein
MYIGARQSELVAATSVSVRGCRQMVLRAVYRRSMPPEGDPVDHRLSPPDTALPAVLPGDLDRSAPYQTDSP